MPALLRDKEIVTLDLASVVAGTKYRGQFEERLKQIMAEIRENPDVILFIDELHTYCRGGWSRGCHRRFEHAEACPEPRRDPVRGRHHHGRVPQVHREGWGPSSAASSQ